jgi:hypothetical protein
MFDSNIQLAKPKWGTLSKQGEICVHVHNNNIIRKQNITGSQQKIITNTFYIAQIDGDKSAELENRGIQAQRLILLNLFSIDFVGPF